MDAGLAIAILLQGTWLATAALLYPWYNAQSRSRGRPKHFASLVFAGFFLFQSTMNFLAFLIYVQDVDRFLLPFLLLWALVFLLVAIKIRLNWGGRS